MNTSQSNIFSVSGVNEYIKSLIDSDTVLSDMTVRGEISNFTNHKSGHFYFTLKDDSGVLRAVMFRSYASHLKFLPENGMKVIAHGKISLFVRDGQYQLYADTMEPDGIGALYIAFEQLKEKLAAEGLFAQEHKKPLPKYPSSIGIITSPTGAAVRDIINIASRRYPLARLVLFPCLVQGESAPKELCSGVRFFNEKHPVDIIILGRGGGSLEELWAFNDEKLARVIYASRIPVISAVGHETDFSISDFVSDLRAPTPSAASELALPDSAELSKYLISMSARMRALAEGSVKLRAEKLRLYEKKRCLTDLDSLTDDRRMTVLRLSERAEGAVKLAMEKKHRGFEALTAKLGALDPLSVIARGYSAVFASDGRLIKSVKSLSCGDEISFRATDGTATAVIKQLFPDDGTIRTEVSD